MVAYLSMKALSLCRKSLSAAHRSTLLRHPVLATVRLHSSGTLPRFLVDDSSDPAALNMAEIEAMVNEWHDLIYQQKTPSAGTVKKRLKERGVTPLPRYTVADAAALDTAAAAELLRGVNMLGLTAISQLAQMGVHVERPPWRVKGSSAAFENLPAVLAILEEWDALRLERRFDEADQLKQRLLEEHHVTLDTRNGRRQLRQRREDGTG